jgi:type IV pilus assembly protein PilY1
MDRYMYEPVTSTGTTVPEVLLVVSKELKMFYQAYAGLIVDIDGDGRLDTGFNPNATYVGYFDSDSCYVHSATEGGDSHRSTNKRGYFQRAGPTVPDDSETTVLSQRPSTLKEYIPSYRSKHGICRGVTKGGKKTWSGNWLNFFVSSRMDAVRKILYGGARTVDAATYTVIEPSFVPHDASVWGTEVMADNAWNRTPFNSYYDITKFTPLPKPNSNTAHYFARVRDRLNDGSPGPWDPTSSASFSAGDGDIFPVMQYYPNAKNSPTCSGGLAGHYWDWIMQSRPVPNASAGCLDDGGVKAWRVSVKVCDPSGSSDGIVAPGEQCRAYVGADGREVWKPTGLLHEYGESGKMKFGLMTGGFSEAMRTAGGIMRNNIGDIGSQINPETGQYNQYSLMWAFDKLQISGRWAYWYEEYRGSSLCYSCMLYSDFNSWGNPMGEMLYEAVRYISGKTSPTTLFSQNETGDLSGKNMTLVSTRGQSPINKLLTANSLRTWSGRPSANECSKPVIMLISDIDASFDGNDIPTSNDLNVADLMPGVPLTIPKALNVASYLDIISQHEGMSSSKKYFASLSSTDDCSPKAITSLKSVKGLCPSGPSYEGSYALAAVAFYAHTHNLSRSQSKMAVDIYSVTMSAAFPSLTLSFGSGRSVSVLPVNTTNRCSYSVPFNPSGYQACNKVLSYLNYFLTDMVTDEEGVPVSYTIQVNFSDFGMADDWEMDMVVEYRVGLLTDSSTPAEYRSAALGSVAGSNSYVSGVFRSTPGNYYFVINPANAMSLGNLVNLNHINVVGVGVYSRLHRTASGGYHGIGYTISGTDGADGTYLDLSYGTPPSSNFLTPPGCAVTGSSTSPCRTNPNTSAQLRTFRFGSAGGSNVVLQNPLWYAAKYGSFTDSNGNGLPDAGEWEDENGNPKTYFQAQNIAELPAMLSSAFKSIAKSISTGTATSASVNSILGGGISIHTAYYPEYVNPANEAEKLRWVGTVYGLFVDKWGNLREDTNGDAKLQLASDKDDPSKGDYVVTFNSVLNPPQSPPACYVSGTPITVCADPKGNNEVEKLTGSAGTPANIHKVKNVWDFGRWLSELDGTKLLSGSRPHAQPARKSDGRRRIYFGEPPTPGNPPPLFNKEPANLAILKKYLVNENFADYLPPVTTPATAFTREGLSERLVEYASGVDIAGWRNRTIANPWGSSPARVTWRLGDVLNSRPVIVGSPSFSYDFLYKDASYAFYKTVRGVRRQVAYFGSNDGMLHAVNLGYYGSLVDGAVGYDSTAGGIAHELGSELWAYVPKTVLPHLQWLASPEYVHGYYVDLVPGVYDVRVSLSEWRTILIAGLRLGGRPIKNPSAGEPGEEPYFHSEFFALDITDPESEPKFLWRYSSEELGLSVTTPSVVQVGGKWYVVFASGPKTDSIDASGRLVYSEENGGNVPFDGYSNQRARLVVLSAYDGAVVVEGGENLTVKEEDSFFSGAFVPIAAKGPVAGDWSNHVLYFGLTVSRAPGTCVDSGGVYRLQTQDPATGAALFPNEWKLKRLVTTDRPVTGAVNSAMDKAGNVWVVFATGRLWGIPDLSPCKNSSAPAVCAENHQQYVYGVKEPFNSNGFMTFEDLTPRVGELKDVSQAQVWLNGMDEPYVSGLYDGDHTSSIKYETYARQVQNDPTHLGYKRALNISLTLFPNDSHTFETAFTQPAITGTNSGDSLMGLTAFEPNAVESYCGSLGRSFLYLLDTFTGLPQGSKAMYEAFATPAEPKISENGNRLITGGISTGTERDTEAVFLQAEGKILIQTASSDDSLWSIEVKTPIPPGPAAISWREVMNTGFELSPEAMILNIP